MAELTEEQRIKIEADADHPRWSGVAGGSKMVWPDGTVVINGKVEKAGPRAVVGDDGRLLDMKAEG